jgi:hypothetical protein
MRKSRQLRCIAAISTIAAAEAPKLLAADGNLSCAILDAPSPALWRRSRNRTGWHEVKQSVPDA